jgi:hypothetical protein
MGEVQGKQASKQASKRQSDNLDLMAQQDKLAGR